MEIFHIVRENGELNGELNESLFKVLQAIQKKPGIKAKEISLELEGRSARTIEKQIEALKEKHLIERRGSKKTGGYYVVSK